MRVLASTKRPDNPTTHRLVQSRVFTPAISFGFQLQHKASCACGGGCPSCQASADNLKVSKPNDVAEIEADQIADRVMRMSIDDANQKSNASHTQNSIHRKCDACAEEEEEFTETPVMRKEAFASAAPTPPPADTPPSMKNVINSGGRPLDRETRNFFEPRFGADLNHVRVHTDTYAAQTARSITAKAYAIGSNIVFGSGEYRPESEAGRHLIAHELAHIIQQTGHINRQDDMDAGTSEPRDADVPVAGVPIPGDAGNSLPEPRIPRICGPDITSSLTTMLGTVEPWFRGLSGFQQARSCAGLGPAGFVVGVNPIMAWDTRELFLPNTSWLDAYFMSRSCGSPRDSGCATDPRRHLCETAGTCGNSVVVGGRCMLAGTANYALFGKICRLCHDYTGRWNRWDMRAIIGAYKSLDWDDSTPPKEIASAAYDGTFPTVPAAAENRGTCTDRCGLTHGGVFDFIWEPYRPR